mmetsp:Transcript_51397/g.116557  ORF Transcript_51397/g.116557 Transcript_51397/m.116557 type:complete len:308 (+) Transcript_51397:72-995(+)
MASSSAEVSVVVGTRVIVPVPLSFMCPISKEIMNDPVATVDGQVYERAAIEYWLRFHGRSPMTNVRLANRSVVPQPPLKRAIDEYCGMMPAMERRACDQESLEECCKILDTERAEKATSTSEVGELRERGLKAEEELQKVKQELEDALQAKRKAERCLRRIAILATDAPQPPCLDTVDEAHASTNLYVRGLPNDGKDLVLRELFEDYGPIVQSKLLNGDAALVRLSSIAAARDAILGLHQSFCEASQMYIEVSYHKGKGTGKGHTKGKGNGDPTYSTPCSQVEAAPTMTAVAAGGSGSSTHEPDLTD